MVKYTAHVLNELSLLWIVGGGLKRINRLGKALRDQENMVSEPLSDPLAPRDKYICVEDHPEPKELATDFIFIRPDQGEVAHSVSR